MSTLDDEAIMVAALALLLVNRDDAVRTGESEAYVENYYDHVIDLLQQRLYKDIK